MNVIETAIPEVLIFEPTIFRDHRGLFLEVFQERRYAQFGLKRPFVQDNLSRSSKGVVRGLHLQNPKAQGKLICGQRGRVLDVAVDVRIGSPTFGRHVEVELEGFRQLWVPRGLAHGFAVLSDEADFFYRCDEFYSPDNEITIRWDDPAIGINWRVDNPKLSARDANAPLLRDVKNLPKYGEV
jgi:dTDP-4-dehydrorhamnose 3,5-epimerase